MSLLASQVIAGKLTSIVRKADIPTSSRPLYMPDGNSSPSIGKIRQSASFMAKSNFCNV